MHFTRLGNRLAVILCAALIATGLSYSYTAHIVSIAGAGFENFGPSLDLVFLSLVSAILPAIWLPTRKDIPSSAIIWVVYLFVYMPSTIIPIYALGDSADRYWAYIVTLAGCMGIASVFCSTRIKPLTVAITLTPSLYIGAIALLSGAGTLLVVRTGGIEWQAFSGIDVIYDIREVKEPAFAASPLAAYTFSILGYGILPVGFALAVVNKKWIMGAFFASCLIAIFAATAQKSFVYMIILLLLVSLLTINGIGPFIKYLLVAVAAATWACVAFSELLSNYIFSILIVQRFLVTPGILSGFYFDFFSVNPYVFLSHGPLRWLLEYPYDRSYPLLVGSTYLGQEDAWANANFWADSYAQGGLVAVLIATLLFGVVLRIADLFSPRHGSRLVLLSMVGPLTVLTNTGFTTTLLSGGLAIVLLLLMVLPPVWSAKASAAERDRFLGC